MLHGMWKKLVRLMLCISLSCIGAAACLAEETEETEDYEAAILILQKEAQEGNAQARNELGECYLSGKGVEQSVEEAFRYFKMAADQGYAVSQHYVGAFYALGIAVEQDDRKAFEYYKLAADQGDADAQNSLAICYENGTGTAQNYEEAARYYKLAAEQGFPEAQIYLGNRIYIYVVLDRRHSFFYNHDDDYRADRSGAETARRRDQRRLLIWTG